MKSKQDMVGLVFKLLNSKVVGAMDCMLAIAFLLYPAYGFYKGEFSNSHGVFLALGLLGVFLVFNKPSKVVEKALRETATKKKPGNK